MQQQNYDTQRTIQTTTYSEVIPEALDLVELNSNQAYGQVRIYLNDTVNIMYQINYMHAVSQFQYTWKEY